MKFDAWGDPIPLYRGDVGGNIHTPPQGTVWVHDQTFGWYPECDCHRPAAITEMRKREAMEQALAARRQGRPWVAPKPPVAADSTPPPIAAPEAVVPVLGAAPAPAPIDDERGLRLMLKRLRHREERNQP